MACRDLARAAGYWNYGGLLLDGGPAPGLAARVCRLVAAA